MFVSVHDVVSGPSPAALNKRDGEYNAPPAIAMTCKAACPLTSAMLLHVDGRSVATALVTHNPGTPARWGQLHSPSATSCVHSCHDVLQGQHVRWETMNDFRILDHDLSADDGAPTTSPTAGRKVTESRSRPLLDSMYDAQRYG